MLQRLPLVTKNILIINVLLFLACQVMPELNHWLSAYFIQSPNFKIWQVITHMFMHGSFTHILFNMFGVVMFGAVLENYWGPKKFLNYYLLCGLGAFGLHEFITYLEIQKLISQLPAAGVVGVFEKGHIALLGGQNYTDVGLAKLNLALNVGLVGASGCLFGLLIAYGTMFPDAQLMLMFIPYPIKAKYFVLGYGAIELLLAFRNSASDNVAHFAHLGGMLIGFAILKYWQHKGKLYS